jgi:methylmalonyl-CoA/ethylmalonyl-CoA epimerase
MELAGVVVDDVHAVADRFEALLDCETVHVEDLDDDLRLLFLDVDNTYIELVEPLGPGTIADYLDRHGPGIHHLALETADIEVAMANARDLGVDLVDEEPRPGAWGHTVAFLDPRTTEGILFEFVEH